MDDSPAEASSRRGPDQVRGSVYLPILACDVPRDWTVSEGMTLRSTSGITAQITIHGSTDSGDLSELSARMLAPTVTASENLEEVDEGLCKGVGGLDAHYRRFARSDAGVSSRGAVFASRYGPIELQASASWIDASQRDSGGSDAFTDVVSLISGFWLTDRESTGRAEVFGGSGSAWSTKELAVIAALQGAAVFPTVPFDVLGIDESDDAPQDASDPVIETVMESFAARGMLSMAEDESRFTGLPRQVLDVALEPELVVLVEAVSADGVRGAWMGSSGDTVVLVLPVEDTTRRILVIDQGDIGSVARDAVCVNVADDRSDSPAPEPTSLSDILSGGSTFSELVTVQVIKRSGGSLGGEGITFAIEDRRCMLAHPDHSSQDTQFSFEEITSEMVQDLIEQALESAGN